MKLSRQLTTVTTFSRYLALSLFIVCPIIGFYVGIQYQKINSEFPVTQQVQTDNLKAIISQTISSSNQMGNLKTNTIITTVQTDMKASLTTSIYSINYPSTWITEKSNVADQQNVYDPNSMEKKMTNGGGAVLLPATYVNVSKITSAEAPKQYVDRMIKRNPAYNGAQAQRKVVTVNGLTAEMYKESGEGSQGYDIVVSNGKTIVVLNIPTADPNADPVIHQILSTFKFTN